MARRYPHELSGGQVQRAAIAMALAGDPVALLMDEPTTGLDVTTQAALLDLMAGLQRESGVAIVCVSHDLGVLARLCQRLMVMYSGAMVEEGPTRALLSQPAHPYTRALLTSLPTLTHPGLPSAIPGRPPDCDLADAGLPLCPALRWGGCRIVMATARRWSTFRRAGGLRVFTRLPAGLPFPVDQNARRVRQPGAGRFWRCRTCPWSMAGRVVWTGFSSARHRCKWLKPCHFSLQRGEILGLVGESGSGKSTILRALAGIHARDAGGDPSLRPAGAAACPLAPAMAAASAGRI